MIRILKEQGRGFLKNVLNENCLKKDCSGDESACLCFCHHTNWQYILNKGNAGTPYWKIQFIHISFRIYYNEHFSWNRINRF